MAEAEADRGEGAARAHLGAFEARLGGAVGGAVELAGGGDAVAFVERHEARDEVMHRALGAGDLFGDGVQPGEAAGLRAVAELAGEHHRAAGRERGVGGQGVDEAGAGEVLQRGEAGERAAGEARGAGVVVAGVAGVGGGVGGAHRAGPGVVLGVGRGVGFGRGRGGVGGLTGGHGRRLRGVG
ncbi:MAG: hypothetical protein H6701_14365 [Myxococcales bacterium]|nr:hypothetical protein [Myxococcales bacterium]